MITLPATYVKLTAAINAFSVGISSGSSLDIIKKASKVVRKARDLAVEVEEAIKMRGKQVTAELDNAANGLSQESKARIADYENAKVTTKPVLTPEEEAVVKAKQKINQDFQEEVNKVNKEEFKLESTVENLEAFKEVLSKIDWTHADIKEQIKEGKMNIGVMLTAEELVEDIAEVLRAGATA